MATKNNSDKKKKPRKKIFKLLILFLFIVSLVTIGYLFFLNILPMNYFLIVSISLALFNILEIFLILGRGWKKRLLGTILFIIAIIGMIAVIFYSISTLDFLNKITDRNYNTKNYSVVVLNSSNYKKLKDIKKEDIGYIPGDENTGMEEAKKYLNKKVKVNYKKYEETDELLDAFLDEDVEAILIEDAEKEIIEEEHEEFLKNEKVIYKFSIDIKINENLAKDVDITKDSFNIFISGIDTYGKITSVSRSDVNMLVSINPKTHKMLFTSIPRDYYVSLHGKENSYKDKLTHAGIHGIDMSVKTVEDLLDTDIHYYAKANFTSLVAIVDKLGGIEVETDEAFRAYYVEDEVVNYYFKKGTNKLNGKQALAYSRERKSLTNGDVGRVKHQQQVLEAIINKALSKNILTNYNELLNSVEGKFVTNLGTKNITKFIKNQIKLMPSWEIEKNTLEGKGDMNYTYSYKKSKSYVMVPNSESLENGKKLIKSTLEEE